MNPLLVEAWRGLGADGSAQRAWLACLACLALLLVFWWPHRDVLVVLSVQRGPNTALALLIGLGLASAWFALALGAEEVGTPGQQALGEWHSQGTPGAAGMVSGLALAHVLQMLVAFALAAPLLLAAAMVNPANSGALGWCLLGAAVQSVWLRLAGANIKLAARHHPRWCSATVRMFFVAALAIPPFFAPFASHFMVSHALLRDGSNAAAGFAGLSVELSHMIFGTLVTALLGTVLYWQLRKSPQSIAE